MTHPNPENSAARSAKKGGVRVQNSRAIRHTPVLLKESVQFLHLQRGQTVVDMTLGQGGHSQAILKKIHRKLGHVAAGFEKNNNASFGELAPRLIGIDRDPAAIDKASHLLARAVKEQRLVPVQGRFSQLTNILQELGHPQVDAILMDLGVSSNQILSSERGFSFAHPDSPLDMRMDPSEDLTAARVLQEWSAGELRDLFFMAGERRLAKRLAQRIVKARRAAPFQTVGQLLALTSQIHPRAGNKKSAAGRALPYARRHSATRVFMALRIAVNHELEELRAGLKSALVALRPGGRLVVITFNSLEDQIVKQTFMEWASSCVCPPELPICRCDHDQLVKILTRKPVKPGPKELQSNARARSAKLRAIEKL